MELKHALDNFVVSIGGDETLFFDKLCQEYGWRRRFAEQAFTEYKRFLYLICASGERQVPSKVIDAVWHLHLTFTQSYWQDLCRDTLGRDIHHNPSSQNAYAAKRDQQNFERTLDLYQEHFQQAPPANIWLKSNPRAIQLRNYIVPFVVSAGLLAACSEQTKDKIDNFIFWGVIIFIVYKVLRWAFSRGRSGRCGGSSCGSSCGSCGGGD
ncbi:glycine-rich domain-containing protein [Corallincola platygyrae]|uniref:Glycine-rich domain-containing protein n=1 Tax=Corallincola platygyrae TaxID=1193278 RepID=A0ABW4XLV4_9GAMM